MPSGPGGCGRCVPESVSPASGSCRGFASAIHPRQKPIHLLAQQTARQRPAGRCRFTPVAYVGIRAVALSTGLQKKNLKDRSRRRASCPRRMPGRMESMLSVSTTSPIRTHQATQGASCERGGRRDFVPPGRSRGGLETHVGTRAGRPRSGVLRFVRGVHLLPRGGC